MANLPFQARPLSHDTNIGKNKPYFCLRVTCIPALAAWNDTREGFEQQSDTLYRTNFLPPCPKRFSCRLRCCWQCMLWVGYSGGVRLGLWAFR
jgi:hypothetical protein